MGERLVAGRPGGVHYTIRAIDSIDDLRAIFVDRTNYTLNWLFCSTSGVHGSYATLDAVEETLSLPPDHDDSNGREITVLVVQPRLVCTRYGTVPVTLDDIAWLRTIVAKTLEGIARSQEGNTPATSANDADELR